MSISFTNKFLIELKNPNRVPNTFIEIDIGSSVTRWGEYKLLSGSVRPVLKSASSNGNSLNVKNNIVTKGGISFTVANSEYIKSVIQNNRLKNLTVKRYQGFIADGWDDTDYIVTFEGVMYNWSKDGEIWTFNARDIREKAQKVAPVAETDQTHYLDFSNMNPIDMMTNFIETQAAIPAGSYDGAKFISERDTWYNGWVFHRVITKSKNISKYLEELQVETNSYIYHDGNKISFKSFAPQVPGATVREFSDNYNLIQGSINNDSGYIESFYNRVEVYYDYDESGNDNKDDNFESMEFSEDADSQTNWGEIKTKVIKSKWIRSFRFDQPTYITGATVYMASKDNGAGGGTLTFNFANQTFTWQATGDTVGSTVTIDRSGKYQIKSLDERKYIRVIVDTTLTPGSNQSDTITLTALAGSSYSSTLANRSLNRFLDPVPPIKGAVDYRDLNNQGAMYAPSDVVNITTDEITIFGQSNFDAEPCMLTEVKFNERNHRIEFKALPTKLGKRAAFIAPTGQPDYASATIAERQYCYIGRTSDNKVHDGVDYVGGYYII